MSKKNYLGILAFAMFAMAGAGFVACGGDGDDDEAERENNGSSTAGLLDHDFSTRIKSAGDYRFFYNGNGQVDYIVDGDTRYDFSYRPNKIVQSYKDVEQAVYSVTYNGYGFITRLDVEEVYEDNGKVEVSGSSLFEYSNTGHLLSVNSSAVLKLNGETINVTNTATLTWQNNRLTSAVWETIEKDEKGTTMDGEAYNYTIDLQASDCTNWHHQHAPSISAAYGGGGASEALAFVKLFGYGPQYLPVSCTEIMTYKGSTSEHKTWQFSYGLNDDRSLSYCTVDNKRWNYGYEHLATDTRAETSENATQGRRHFRMFRTVHSR